MKRDALWLFRNLSQVQHRNQHDKPGSYPQYFSANILKHYLLVHDVFSGVSDAEAQKLFMQVGVGVKSAIVIPGGIGEGRRIWKKGNSKGETANEN